MRSAATWLAAGWLLAAPPAGAHAILMQSVPAAGAHLPAGPAAFTLRFNSLIDAERSRVLLSGLDGPPVVMVIAGSGQGDTLSAHQTLAPGRYRLQWQVLALDGHITRGFVPFTVDRVPPSAPR